MRDHVGRSFSRIKVYTDRPSWVPTARRPRMGQKVGRVKDKPGCTRFGVEGSYCMGFRKGEGRMDAPRILLDVRKTPGGDARVHCSDYLGWMGQQKMGRYGVNTRFSYENRRRRTKWIG